MIYYCIVARYDIDTDIKGVLFKDKHDAHVYIFNTYAVAYERDGKYYLDNMEQDYIYIKELTLMEGITYED